MIRSVVNGSVNGHMVQVAYGYEHPDEGIWYHFDTLFIEGGRKEAIYDVENYIYNKLTTKIREDYSYGSIFSVSYTIDNEDEEVVVYDSNTDESKFYWFESNGRFCCTRLTRIDALVSNIGSINNSYGFNTRTEAYKDYKNYLEAKAFLGF